MSTNRRWSRRASVLAALTTVASMSGGAALADTVYNDVDTSIDAVAEVMSLNAGGPNGTTTLRVETAGGDGKPGCNLTGSTTLMVNVESANTAVAIVAPSSVTFTSCGADETLTVTPVAQGATTISLSQVSNTTGGSFNLAPATFTVNVAPATSANTAPTIAVSGVSAGESYAEGSELTPTCHVTDAEDGDSTFPASLSAITGPYAADGIGSQTASCSYTDGGGLEASASASYSIVDQSAPEVFYVLNPAAPDGAANWYRSNVTLTWTVTEPQSPSSLATTGCVNQTVTSDQASTSYSCSASSAGGSTEEVTVSFKRDSTKPVISGSDVADTTWRNTPLSESFNASDGLSGLADDADSSFTLTAADESADAWTPTSVSKSVFDQAGNSATRTLSALIDVTDPHTPTFVAGPAADATYWADQLSSPTCTAVDALSGLKECVVSGYSTATGTHTMTATATDMAGNVSTSTSSYTVRELAKSGFYAPVDMGGVWNTVKGGSTVPLKFELFDVSATGVRTELSDTSLVSSFSATKVSCTTGGEDVVESFATTGGTSLRYDTTGGQFIQNWKTPTGAGTCYKATMTAQDGSSISALFKIK